MKLIRKDKIKKSDTVYNLHVEKNHNYFANNTLVSNCHSAKADELKKLLTGPFANVPIRWGLTGTVPKQDFEQASLLGSIGPVIHGVSAKELQEAGILSNCHIDIIQTQEKTASVGRFPDERKFLSSDPTRLEWFADFIQTAAENGNTLILINQLDMGKKLTKLIPDSVFISGSVEVQDREDHYEKVSTEDNKIIIATYGVAAVGINVPRIFNLILFEPGKSFVRNIQSIGRGLRRAKDKDFVQIFDICASTKYSRKHLTERKKFYKECEYPFKVNKVDIYQ